MASLRLKAVAAAGVLSVAIVAWSPSAASAAGCNVWGAQPVSPSSNNNVLNGVTVLSTCNAWTVGDYYDNSLMKYEPLIERWNGKAWKVQKAQMPGTDSNELDDVDALSARNVWAVGHLFNGANSKPLIEHWNGKAWKAVKSPSFPGTGELAGISAVSPHDVWVVGEHHRLSQQDRTLIEHWNGRAWKIVPSPRVGTLENDLQGVAATSADNAWAVGHHVFPGGGDRTLILHWNGTAWKVQHSPNPGDPNDFLMDVAATSASNAWAVGVQSRGGIDKTLILRWNGTAWRTSNSPKLDSKFNRLDGVTATSARNAWAVGSQYHQGIFARTLIEHWNGKAWMVQPSPNPSTDDNVLNDVDASSSSIAWSVGSYDMSGSYAFAVHCC